MKEKGNNCTRNNTSGTFKKFREEYSSLTQIIKTVVRPLFFKVLSLPSSESTDVTLLKFGLHYSFGDKNYIIRNVAA